MDYFEKVIVNSPDTSETSPRRHLTSKYCVGNGVDIGSQGTPVNINSIQIEYSRDRFYGIPIQLECDGTSNLPFKDNILDYVYSSHLIEDYEFDHWESILAEWNRIIKIGGFIVIMLPDKILFRECVKNGQPDNLNHKHEGSVGELTKLYNDKFKNFDVLEDYITDRYNILFVAKKLN